MHIFDFHFTTFLLTYLFILIITGVIYKFRKKKCYHSFRYYLAIVWYFLLLIKVTMLPICILTPESMSMFKSNIGDGALFYRLIPFTGFSQYFYSIYGIVQLLGNIILLMPIVPMLRWFSRKKYSYSKIIGIILVWSLAIELMQFFINKITQYPSHLSDVNDVILNVFGGLLGIILCKVIEAKLFGFIVRVQKFFLNMEISK